MPRCQVRSPPRHPGHRPPAHPAADADLTWRGRLREDLDTAARRDPAARSRAELVLAYPGLHAVWVHRLSHRLWQRGGRLPARVVSHLARAATGVEIHPGATIETAPLDAPWLESWREADARARQAMGAVLGGGLSEPAVAIRTAAALTPNDTLFVASSMPIRDVETFAVTPARVLSNRGANGIDGLIAKLAERNKSAAAGKS